MRAMSAWMGEIIGLVFWPCVGISLVVSFVGMPVLMLFKWLVAKKGVARLSEIWQGTVIHALLALLLMVVAGNTALAFLMQITNLVYPTMPMLIGVVVSWCIYLVHLYQTDIKPNLLTTTIPKATSASKEVDDSKPR